MTNPPSLLSFLWIAPQKSSPNPSTSFFSTTIVMSLGSYKGRLACYCHSVPPPNPLSTAAMAYGLDVHLLKTLQCFPFPIWIEITHLQVAHRAWQDWPLPLKSQLMSCLPLPTILLMPSQTPSSTWPLPVLLHLLFPSSALLLS